MNEIFIRDQKVFAYHGVLESEKKEGQDFLVSTKVRLDYEDTFGTDDLSDTVSYAELAKEVESFAKSRKYNLIETLALKLADNLLDTFEDLREVEITIKKPKAPMNAEFDYVGVTVKKKWHEVYISLGSNIGDRKKMLEEATEKIEAFCRVIKKSEMMETKPWGKTNQDDFLNAVVLLETKLEPVYLLRQLQKIERELGRKRVEKWGPRTIDLDILYFDDIIMDTEELTLPHPFIENRDFVLKPLSQIAPHKVNPVNGLSTIKMLSRLE